MPMFDIQVILVMLGTAVIGGIIGLDRTAAGQFMISQPIVAAPLTGWVLGDPTAGIIIGAVLELIWVVDMPIGTFVPANSTISAVSATAIAALAGHGTASLPMIGFSLLLTTCMVPVTMMADKIVRTWNSRLINAAEAVSGEHFGRALAKAHFTGLGMFYLKSFVLYLIFLPAGIAALEIFGHLPENVHRAMSLFVKLLPMLGAGLIVRKLSIKTIDAFLMIGFMIAALLGQVIHAPAIIVILLTVMGGWLGARYSELRRQG